MERKFIKFDVKAIDEEQGIIEGYGATFSKNPDSYGDIIDHGAFSKTLKENADSIVSLFNHSIMEPIGLPELSQDKDGLYAKIKLVLEVPRAREVLALAKAGVIKRMSIGYETVKSDLIDGVRHLKEVRLYDVSPVVFAANPEAMILGVKEAEEKAGRVLSAANISKVRAALSALQALLEASSGDDEEPDKSTPYPGESYEAAELDSVIAGLKAENEGFDEKEAEARIDKLLAKIR